MFFLLFLFKVIFLVNVTFSVPDKVHKVMKLHSEIKWTEIARKPVIELAERIESENVTDVAEIVRAFRDDEEGNIMREAKNDPQKAVEIWEKRMKQRLAKMKMPKWWKNATATL